MTTKVPFSRDTSFSIPYAPLTHFLSQYNVDNFRSGHGVQNQIGSAQVAGIPASGIHEGLRGAVHAATSTFCSDQLFASVVRAMPPKEKPPHAFLKVLTSPVATSTALRRRGYVRHSKWYLVRATILLSDVDIHGSNPSLRDA